MYLLAKERLGNPSARSIRAPSAKFMTIITDYTKAMLHGYICESIGGASLCWNPKPAGEFDSTKALAIADYLESKVLSLFEADIKLAERKKPARLCNTLSYNETPL